MLNLIKSGFTADGHGRINKAILERVSKSLPTLLLVPEQQTLIAEAEMADLLPSSAPIVFEVTNFTRLANTAARALGGLSGEYCDKTKKALIMWRTLTELSPILSSASSLNEGTVNRYLAASAQLDALGIDAELLSRASDSQALSDNRLKRKMQDLCAVHTLYKKLIAEKYGSSEDECRKMLEKLKENPDYLQGTAIFIEGFISFTETQYALIKELIKRCDVTVLLYISHASGESFEYTEVRLALERLKKECRLADSPLRVFTEDSRSSGDETISILADLLWRKSHGFDKLSLQNPEKLRIIEAETPFDECEFIASDIKRRVMSGESFSDFAIVARSANKYDGILDTALSLASIPAFVSKKKDVTSLEAVKLIFTAYAVLRSRFARESLISYAKCALGGISRDECDELEYYAEKWQINGSRFTDGEIWNMNPDGYSATWREGAAERVARINEIRERLVSPLVAFEREVSKAKTVRAQAEALISHLTAIGVPEALAARKKALLAMGEAAHAEEADRLWKTVCDAVDTLVEVSGDLEADADSFASQLKICFGNVDISKLPSFVDQVTVGSADMIRLYGKKHIYLIGVNAGEFPGNVSDNAYFTESDKLILASLGLSVAPELEEKGARELYLFARALTYAKETVTLSYTLRDTRFKPRERSEVVDKAIKIFGGELRPIKLSRLSARERLWSSKAAPVAMSELSENEKADAKEALCLSGEEKSVKICEESITNDTLSFDGSLTRKAGDKRISLTQSRIDSFNNCPLGYFCRYTLNLEADERAEFDARNIGTFIHAILENVFRELCSRDADTALLTKEERFEITENAAKKYVSELGDNTVYSSERTKIKINRLVRAALPVVDGLCDEFGESKFKPRFFELAITKGKDDLPEPVTVTTERGNEVFVYGYIDRVDTYEKDGDVYVRVVDYKTGAKTFSPTDPAEGKNLQMFLYLKAILDSDKESFKQKAGVLGGRIIPAGVIYVKTAIGDTKVPSPDDALAEKAVKAAQKREGMVLCDDEIISAMGLKHTPLYSARTPDKIPESKMQFTFTEESLADIMNDALSVTAKVADRISEGDINAVPKIHEGGKTYCDSCEFKPVCRKAIIK